MPVLELRPLNLGEGRPSNLRVLAHLQPLVYAVYLPWLTDKTLAYGGSNRCYPDEVGLRRLTRNPRRRVLPV